MRFAFVSLSLLLFALCRYSYASVSWQTLTSTSSESEAKIIQGGEQQLKLDKVKILKLLDILGNTFFGMFFGSKLQKDSFFKKSLANGILCEFADIDGLSNKVTDILYGHEISASEHEAEVKDATALGFGCDGDKKDPCFCVPAGPYKSFIYCKSKVIHEQVLSEGYTKKTCREEAIASLKTKGTKTLGNAFDVNLVLKDDVSTDEEAQIDKLVKQGADLLCDTLDSDVEQGVKAVYAADALYWTIDLLITQAIYGEPEKDLKGQCDDIPEEVKKIPFLKCICDLDKGVSFCYFYHAANLLKESGFLNCKDKKFDDTKSKPKSLGIKESASKIKGGGGGSSSANQISLLAPMAAVAALLL